MLFADAKNNRTADTEWKSKINESGVKKRKIRDGPPT